MMIEVENKYWKSNLYICLFGSFTTIMAMTSMLPFLPLYVEELGISGHAGIMRWSSIAFSITFISAAISAPVWGYLADKYGRKPMLTRAALGMAIITAFMGSAQNITQLIILRFVAGLAGGYGSGSTILIATQAPKKKSGWALGLLSSGVMAGNLAGPLIGGFLPPLVGIKGTFWIASGVIFLTFIITALYIKEDKPLRLEKEKQPKAGWRDIPAKRQIFVMLSTALLLMFAIMSIEPILTIFVTQLNSDKEQLTLVAGIVISASSLGSILSASRLGKIADKIGHIDIVFYGLAAASFLLVLQAFVTAPWQLIVLRFLMGLALGGLLPCITSYISHLVNDRIVSQVLGYSLSFQFAGQVAGPLFGGFVGGCLGTRAVFICTAAIMALGAINVRSIKKRNI